MKILNNTNEMVKYLSEEEETMLRQINFYIGCKVERGTEGQPWDIDPEEYNMENSTPIPFILKQLERNADSPVIGRLWASINK